jgi:D-cysteine desulfhydrase
VGGVGSHHLLALALFLRDQERLLHALTFAQELTPHVRRNLAVLVSTGAKLWHVRSRSKLPIAWAAYHGWMRPRRPGHYLDAGASTPLGCFGFVEAGLELAEQIDAGVCPRPRTIYIAAGSAGTAAGLALGLALAGVSTHLHLVSSVEPLVFNRVLYRRKLGQALAALRGAGLSCPRSVERLLARVPVTFEIDHRQVGRGYGVPTPAARHAVEVAAAHGIGLETTYTAKCVATVLADRGRAGPFLFWHTHAGNDLSPYIVEGWEELVPRPIA